MSAADEAAEKLPWLKFFPADHLGETGLKLSSLAARGLWADMLCVMHQATPYGHLAAHGKALEIDQLARIVGARPEEVKPLLAELEGNRVFSRTPEGMIFCRRMVRADHLRQVRAAAGREGGKRSAKKRG